MKTIYDWRLVPTYLKSDQMARLFSNIWPCTSMKICLMPYTMCQSRPENLPNSNKISKNCPRLWRFFQGGKISPNLVTLSGSGFVSFVQSCKIKTFVRIRFALQSVREFGTERERESKTMWVSESKREGERDYVSVCNGISVTRWWNKKLSSFHQN